MPEPLPHLQVRCDATVGALRLQCDFALRQPWTVLFGPSGSGKSSLLRFIAGLWRSHRGDVMLHGRSLGRVAPHLRRICYVSQTTSLFPHYDVTGNVGFGARRPGGRETVKQALDYFGLSSLARARVATLSGGEAQRVSLARALVSAPELLLLDESFTGMHENLRSELLVLLHAQTIVPSLRILSVTHNVAEAFESADEVLRLENGRVVAQGPSSMVLAEARARLLALLGEG